MVKNPPAMQETWVQSLGQEDPVCRRKWLLLQYFCLDSPMDRGAWQATVHSVTKSQTQLTQDLTHMHTHVQTSKRGFVFMIFKKFI